MADLRIVELRFVNLVHCTSVGFQVPTKQLQRTSRHLLTHLADLHQRVVRLNFALTVHAALSTARAGTSFHGDVVNRGATTAHCFRNGAVADIGTYADDHDEISKCVELE